ncbi:MAG TPA: alpha-glycosidase [Clostridia bacterium]|nr:alpha-glycosidase [Clostridia bacterium]
MSGEWIRHDTHKQVYRSPFGAVRRGQKVILRLGIKAQKKVDKVILRLQINRQAAIDQVMKLEKIEKGIAYYCTELRTKQLGLHWYYFVITSQERVCYYGNNKQRLGGLGVLSNTVPPAFQITVYHESFTVPDWFKEGIIYQIFVDRFHNGLQGGKIENPKKGCLLHAHWNDTPCYIREPDGSIHRWNFFGGNLKGVIKKLPYLKELGISIIYFNPIFESPSNHKYDTSDYKKIDPMFGDEALFRELCTQAKEMGIRIILDGVFSHTGSDSIYFNREGNYSEVGAYQSPNSPYYSWYRFHHYPDDYESWWGIGTLPNVNELEPTYLDFMLYDEDSVVKRWLKKGASGWRLDVADELPDRFIKEMRKVMKEVDPQSVLLGEVWEDASHKISYGENREYLWGEELDSVMNYPFRDMVLKFILGDETALTLQHRLMNLYENYPRHHFYSVMNLIGSHDVPRILTLLGEAPPEHTLSERERENYRLNPRQRRLALNRLQLLVLLQMTFPGVPAIYYGDEVGMEGYADPFNRGPFPWGREDRDLLAHYRQVIALRNRFIALRKGSWRTLWAEGDVYSFLRTYQGESLFIVLNRHPTAKRKMALELTGDIAGEWQEIFPAPKKRPRKAKVLTITLQPLEGKVFLKK